MKWNQIGITFLIGLLFGTFLSGPLMRNLHRPKNRDEAHARMLKYFSSKLDLSETQKKQVADIFGRHRPEMDAILEGTRSKVEAIRAETKKEIMEILTPEQQTKYIKLDAKMEKRFDRRFPPPPPPTNS